MQEVLRAHNSIVRQQVTAFGGFEVKSMGDGFMLAFSSARRALQCAVAMQQDFSRYSGEHHDETLLVRICLHTGEAGYCRWRCTTVIRAVAQRGKAATA